MELTNLLLFGRGGDGDGGKVESQSIIWIGCIWSVPWQPFFLDGLALLASLLY